MLRDFVFTRSLLGKVLELSWRGYRPGVEALRLFRLIRENSLAEAIASPPGRICGGCLHSSRYYVAEF